jgi:uncharacterized protein (DUF1501 family)
MTRRTFLQTAPFFVRAARAAKPDRDANILVVLQLAGGNDGLNTIVPYGDDHYCRARTSLRLSANQVHKLGNGLGFHPALEDMKRLYDAGHLSVVQGVGYPNMHRDHNVGMQSWQTATIASREKTFKDQTGWLGRVADTTPDGVPVTFIGTIPPPLAVHAQQAVIPAIPDANSWTLSCPPTLYDASAPAFAAARRVTGILKSPTGRYPDLPLAHSFQTVSQLIRADVGIQIYLVEQGGTGPGEFDNHANQAVNHAVSLRELSQSITAFCDDLAQHHLLDRVLLMTYSEFGRTLTENGRHGTGHGAAAPVLLAGGRIKPGLIGAHPSLADLDADAPKPHTDFRSVYATALEPWLGIPAVPILGGRFPTLDVLALTPT